MFYHLVKQVPRPTHKKKARMARTRSDFLTRGTFADGEGDTEEDDYDGNFEFLLSSDLPPHPEAGPAARLGQACYSDSEMVIFQLVGEGEKREQDLRERFFANLGCTDPTLLLLPLTWTL